MVWTIEYTDTALRKLTKLDRTSAAAIVAYMDKRIATSANPRDFGKALTGSLKGRWRFKVGDYRVLCSIKNDRLVVLVIDLGHRSEIYR